MEVVHPGPKLIDNAPVSAPLSNELSPNLVTVVPLANARETCAKSTAPLAERCAWVAIGILILPSTPKALFTLPS
jgi:hypothetical protein